MMKGILDRTKSQSAYERRPTKNEQHTLEGAQALSNVLKNMLHQE
jgi:hypothetical protein